MSPRIPGSNTVWFGVSMVLVGLVIGYGVSVGFGGMTIAELVGVSNEPESVFTAYAAELKLNKRSFQKCMENGTYTVKIKEQMDRGADAGINGTPGNILVNNATGEAVIVSGAQPLQNFKNMLEAMRSGELPEEVEFAQNVPPIDLATDHIRGDKNAAYSLIEYSDFECPFCARHWPTMNQLIADDSDVNWVYRHFPLGFHPQAQPAAEASECAAEQGKFWEYADLLSEKGVN
ncbi:MAG: thioredoxin domain-containing protein [Candidatus Peribacteraceae bacterium]|nr:thioredoxin domain-containing protein [Candidatus Peribacteraceae bacterium]